MAFVIRGLIVEISTSQIGQNFAGVKNSNELQTDKSLDQVRPEVNVEQQNLEKNSTPSAEDIQANSDSADNFQREGRSQDLDIAVEEIQSFLQVQNRNLAFSIDDDTKRSVVTVKDSSSGDVIRQIPSDEVLRLAERIKDLQQNLEKNSTPSAEDIQANSDSADNFQREGRSQDLDIAVEEIQSFLQVQNRNLAFSIDDDTKRSVVTVKDSSSGDVIRQIPSDEVLRLAERIKDLQQDIGSSVGVLLNKEV